MITKKKMKKIIITGCNGFIGRSLVSNFTSQDYHVIGIDRNDPPDEISNLFNYKYYKLDLPSKLIDESLIKYQPEYVIHAAGPSSIIASLRNPSVDFSGSVINLYSLLDGIRKYSPTTKIIFLSSAAVYGNVKVLPISEKSQIKPISPYGFHKLLCEMILDEFYQLYNLQSCIIRIFSVYGRGLKSRIFWDICKQASKSKTVSLFGNGNETRDFIHMKDLMNVVNIVIEKGNYNAVRYNVASGTEVKICDLAKIIINNLNLGNEIIFNNQKRKGDPDQWVADIGEINELGFRPSVDIESGLKEYTQWFIKEVQ